MDSITFSLKDYSYLHTRDSAIEQFGVVSWAVNDMRSC